MVAWKIVQCHQRNIKQPTDFFLGLSQEIDTTKTEDTAFNGDQDDELGALAREWADSNDNDFREERDQAREKGAGGRRRVLRRSASVSPDCQSALKWDP